MNTADLDKWVRAQEHITTDQLRSLLGVTHVGGSTWIQIARVLTYHGFERDSDGWARKHPSPSAPCPTYRQLQKAASDRRARCRAALLQEQKKDPTKYEPENRDPEVQDPQWAARKP
jgi:hypothetical protein